MANPSNVYLATGRLASDPVLFPNKDGSRTVRFTLMVQDNFITKSTGKREAQAVELQSFLRADASNGVYDLIGKGDLISVSASVRSNNYIDKEGKRVYTQSLVVDSIQMQEGQAVTAARRAQHAAEAPAAPVAAAPATDAAAAQAAEIARLEAELAAAQNPFQG